MKVTRDMKIRDVLALDEEKMLSRLMMLAPEFERLKYPRLRRAMSGRVSVAQAARIARVPLTEMLYALNIALGEDESELSAEIFADGGWDDFTYTDTNLPTRPADILGLKDTDPSVTYVDLMPQAEAHIDPMPAIARGLLQLSNKGDVLLLRHPFDPIPLRDLFARRGFESWAEERKAGEWFIYFYRPRLALAAFVHPQVKHAVYVKAFGAAA